MRYAGTVAEVGLYPLRRRDRAAMVLALECCRRNFRGYTQIEACSVRVHAAMTALGMSDGPAMSVWDALGGTRVSHARHVRARLALLLRVLLRADAGEGYETYCTACARVLTHRDHLGECPAPFRRGTRTGGPHHRATRPLPVRPLWEVVTPAPSPATDPGTRG